MKGLRGLLDDHALISDTVRRIMGIKGIFSVQDGGPAPSVGLDDGDGVLTDDRLLGCPGGGGVRKTTMCKDVKGCVVLRENVRERVAGGRRGGWIAAAPL